MLRYKPGPTGARFLQSRSFVKAIMGPVGGGKSTVALFDLLGRAVSQAPFKNVRRTKFIILRNTMAQLKSTVKPLIDQWFITMTDGRMGQWRLTDMTFEARFALPDGTTVHSEFVLMPADTPDDVRRLLSLEASAAWVEEAREVDSEVFNGLQGRVNRFPNRMSGGVTYPGVICSTNPPPRGGFWHEIISNPPKGYEVFIQPPALLEDGSLNPEAENLENLAPDYYENLVAGKTDAWIDVYLKNLFGAGDMGQPVYKASYRKHFHVSDKPLKPILQSVNPLIIGMDNGLQAAAALMQMDARGRVNVLGEAYVPAEQTMGVESFLDRLLIPRLVNEFPFRRENIVFVLDPACFQRSQVDEKTIAQAVQQRGFRVLKAQTNDPQKRIEAVEGLLARQIDGGPGFLIDPRCEHICDALEWGYRYKTTASGQINLTVEKNHFSHIGDAVQYGSLHYNLTLSGAALGRGQAKPVQKSSFIYT
jgi:hypothetical protein